MNLSYRKGVKKRERTESNWSGKEVFFGSCLDISEKLLRRQRMSNRG